MLSNDRIFSRHFDTRTKNSWLSKGILYKVCIPMYKSTRVFIGTHRCLSQIASVARGPFYMGWRTTLSDTYLICFLIVKPLTKKVNSRNLHRRHFNSDPLIVTHHHILMLTCVCSVWDKSLVSNIRQTINFHFLMVPPYKNHSYEHQFVNRQAVSSGC